jgi:hypothetical protein
LPLPSPEVLHNHASIPSHAVYQHTVVHRLRITLLDPVKIGTISKIIIAGYVRASIRKREMRKICQDVKRGYANNDISLKTNVFSFLMKI